MFEDSYANGGNEQQKTQTINSVPTDHDKHPVQ